MSEIPRVNRIQIHLWTAEDGGKVVIEAKKPSGDNVFRHDTFSKEEALAALEDALDLLFVERERQLTVLRDKLVVQLSKAQTALKQ